MIPDLITALTVLFSLGIIGGTIIICLVITHAHDERMAEADREDQRSIRQDQRSVRGVR